MNTLDINNCPGTLAPGFKTYSATCLKNLFMGKKVNHILPYSHSQNDEEDAEKFLENRSRISISGVQEKVSMIMIKNKLRLTEKGEQGTYILKPIPRDLRKPTQVPANEHLTMQIAKQVYGINTAENALIFFNNGDPAYITKRFDVKPDGTKLGKEDFASLAGKTKDTAGPDFKYEYSYEEAAQLLKKYVQEGSKPKNITQVGIRMLKFCNLYDLKKISDNIQQYSEPFQANYPKEIQR